MAQSRLNLAVAICAAVLISCGPTGSADAPPDPWNEAVAKTKPRPSKRARTSASPTPSNPSASPTASGAPAPSPGPHGSQQVTGSSAVALTFDDGPDPTWTPKVLALLRKHKVKATFCVVGIEVKRHPKLIGEIVRDGHTLCNHTWDHDLRLGKRTPGHIKANLARTNAAIISALPGAQIPYFRQPGGMWTKRGVRVVREMNMTPLHWNVDPRDWTKPPARQISSFVKRETKKGDIVLLHDGGGNRTQTYRALHDVLPHLTRRFQLTPL